MPRRQVVFAAGHYYHIYNRGLNRATVFFSERNYIYFLKLLKANADQYNIAVTAYCLMPNHYHLLLKSNLDNGIPQLMKGVTGAYVQAVNREQGRQGTLFQGRFRAVWVDRESYLLYLACYIHLNPVESGLVSGPERWPYSNYSDVIGVRLGRLKDTTLVPDYFDSGEMYRKFVEEELLVRRSVEKIKAYWLD